MTSTASLDTVLDLLRADPQSEAELEHLAREAQLLPAGELVYLVDTRPATEAALLFRVLDKARALAVFEGLSPDHQAELISALRTPQVAEIIGDLDPDDRASLFDELPASVAERLMHGLDADERAMTTAVLGYPRHAIGRYMSPEVLALRPEQTVAEALAEVRERGEDAETVYLLPVVDSSRVLLGVVGLRRLLLTAPEERVGDLAHEAVRARATDDREEAARRFFAAKLLAMPIVDAEERLVGVLTVDDAVDIIERENAEDSARTSGSEPLTRSYLATPILRVVRSRIVWLLVLAVSAILTVQVLEIFEDRLEQVVVLAVHPAADRHGREHRQPGRDHRHPRPRRRRGAGAGPAARGVEGAARRRRAGRGARLPRLRGLRARLRPVDRTRDGADAAVHLHHGRDRRRADAAGRQADRR